MTSPYLHLITLMTCLLCLTACGNIKKTPQQYLTQQGMTLANTDTIETCRGYGCAHIDTVPFSNATWNAVTATFTPRATTPKQEREMIKTAIATFETIIGATNGTDEDIGGTFYKIGNRQLDCVDESTNTSRYLLALQERELLIFHTVESPSFRLPIIHAGRWPHQSAAINETSTDITYVVDSWYHDNGQPPEIIPLEQWNKGWKPTQAPPQNTPNAEASTEASAEAKNTDTD